MQEVRANVNLLVVKERYATRREPGHQGWITGSATKLNDKESPCLFVFSMWISNCFVIAERVSYVVDQTTSLAHVLVVEETTDCYG